MNTRITLTPDEDVAIRCLCAAEIKQCTERLADESTPYGEDSLRFLRERLAICEAILAKLNKTDVAAARQRSRPLRRSYANR